MIIHKSLDEILETTFVGHDKIPINDLMGFEQNNYSVRGTSTNGEPFFYESFNEFRAQIEKQNFYGYVKDNEEIHIWYDGKQCNMIDLIQLIAHEIGHTKKPFHKNPSKEEIKAEGYAEVAIEAYRKALELSKINE